MARHDLASPTWELRDGRLAYFDGHSWTVPTSRQVWSALFVGHSFASSPRDALPSLAFSRLPAEAKVCISGSIEDVMSATLALQGDNGVIRGIKEKDLPDQIVLDTTWYPVEVSELVELQSRLKQLGVLLGVPLTIGDLIKLELSDLRDILVNDVAARSPASAVDAHSRIQRIEGLKAELYPYQRSGVSFLAKIVAQRIGCILGDEMGLGKTMQIIALLLLERAQENATSLVVVPATLVANWRRELELFAPALTLALHVGPNRVGSPEKLQTFNVVVTTYETAVNDQPLLSSVPWNLVILDEAQNIKNPNAARTKAVKSLGRKAAIAVTGTPVENRLTDLWSISDFILPGLLGSLGRFQVEFDDSAEDASRLAPVVAPLLLRRKVAEVAKDLPARIDIPQRLEMPPHMAEQYEEVRESAAKDYAQAAGLVTLQKLRMYCADPLLIGATEAEIDSNPKFERLLEILEELFARREKALIFTSYLQVTDLLRERLSARFRAFIEVIDGRVPPPARLKVVDDFSSANGAAVLILNPKAGGVGLNITAANHVIHYNLEWNPAVVDQASARSYRRKQTRPVTVHYFYFADSVEEVILDRLDFKRSLAANALHGHQGDLAQEDILRALQITPIKRV